MIPKNREISGKDALRAVSTSSRAACYVYDTKCEKTQETAKAFIPGVLPPPDLTSFGEYARSDRARTQGIGRAAGSALRVFGYLQQRPIASVTAAADATDLTFPTVSSAMNALARLGIVQEVTGRHRGKMFAYTQYLQILGAGV